MKHLWRRFSTLCARTTKVVVLSLVLMASLLGSVAPAYAQQSIDYQSYTNLFKGTNPNPLLSLYSLFEPNTTTPNVRFNLQMSFKLDLFGDPTTEPVGTKEAAWNHIRDFRLSGGSYYVFILRICKSQNENLCVFARIPHETQELQNTPTNQSSDKIYHYRPGGTLQNDKFNVLFPVTEVYTTDPTTGQWSRPSPISTFMAIGDREIYKADAWYCAGEVSGEQLPTQDNPSNPNYRMFNNLCGDNRPYFKIATSAEFRMPQTAAEAQAQTPGAITPVDTTPTQSAIPSCGVFNGSIMGCVAQIVYYLVYRPVAWFAGVMGNLFDFFLGYSLSDSSYRAEFAIRGWQIVRDICNIFFIIILVYVGLATVFNTSSFNPKKVLVTLILNALLINFSLLATRVVIDVSNIVARVFYHSVQVCDGECQKDENTGAVKNPKPGIAGYTPLSEKIVSSFNPQKIFSMNVLSTSSMLPDNGTTAQGGAKTLSVGDSEYAGYYTVVSLIAAVILFAVAMMFWKTAFFFLGRVIGLYMAMIFAPFAFLGRGGVPLVSGIKELSWNNWWSDLTKYATLAPIFVFFLYVIYSLLETDFIKVYQDRVGTNFFETVVYIAIPMLIVYFMIKQGVGLAESYAGKFGTMVQNYAQKATGLVGGAALGAGALMGGRVIGGMATSLNKSKAGEWLRDKGKSSGMGGWLARRSISTLNATEKSSFDARKTQLGSTLFKEMGINTDQKALSALSGMGLGLGTSSTAGGYHGQIERYQKKQEAESKLLESKQSQGDIDAYNEKVKKEYQSKVDAIVEEKMVKAYGKAQVDKWKTNDKDRYEQERMSILKMDVTQTAIAAIEKPQEKKSVQEMNAERRDKFAENLKKGDALGDFLGEDSLIGAMVGVNTRREANKKAAKKITESAKIEKDLTEINQTLKDGFREVVAMEKLKNDRLWTTSLTADQRKSLLRGEKIEFIDSTGKKVNGGFYDFVKDRDINTAKALDVDVTAAENDKDRKKEILEQIKARQQFKFDFKELNKEIKDAEDTYANTPNPQNLKKLTDLKAKRVKLKNEQKKWQDLDKYIEEQKKKLEGKE